MTKVAKNAVWEKSHPLSTHSFLFNEGLALTPSKKRAQITWLRSRIVRIAPETSAIVTLLSPSVIENNTTLAGNLCGPTCDRTRPHAAPETHLGPTHTHTHTHTRHSWSCPRARTHTQQDWNVQTHTHTHTLSPLNGCALFNLVSPFRGKHGSFFLPLRRFVFNVK